MQVYAVPSGELLSSQDVRAETAEQDARRAGALAASAAGAVCVVVFDGDSGRRWSADEIARAFSPQDRPGSTPGEGRL